MKTSRANPGQPHRGTLHVVFHCTGRSIFPGLVPPLVSAGGPQAPMNTTVVLLGGSQTLLPQRGPPTPNPRAGGLSSKPLPILDFLA